MQLSPAVTSLEDAVDTQLRIAGPEIAEAGGHLMRALEPAIRQTMMEVVAMAVTEISNQLDAQTIDVNLVDGDPELRVRDDYSATTFTPPSGDDDDDDDEARITVRLPGYLKDLIANEAEGVGDSLNSYVVDVLNKKTSRRQSGGTRTRTTVEL